MLHVHESEQLSDAAVIGMKLLDTVTRRALLATIPLLSTIPTKPVVADAEHPLWPKDGLFKDCPASSTCISSQDDRPFCWDNPWVADGSLADGMEKLVRVLTSARFNGRVIASDERYLRVEFEERSALGGTTVDDAEFFFTPDDVLVQFRASRRGDAQSDFGANRQRLEKARIALGWEKVPVLRNRRRALVVVESPLDSFGPALYSDTYSDADPLAAPFTPPSKFMRAWMRESDDRVRSR